MNFIFSWQKQYNIMLPLENNIHIFAPPSNKLYIKLGLIKQWINKTRIDEIWIEKNGLINMDWSARIFFSRQKLLHERYYV